MNLKLNNSYYDTFIIINDENKYYSKYEWLQPLHL